MTATTSEKQIRSTKHRSTSVGHTVADARRDLGLTVTDLAERTRIRPHIIRDIERDDYASCRGAFYARGHVKALTAVLGLDAEPLLAELDDAHGAAVPALRTTALPDWSPGEPGRADDSGGGPRWLTGVLVVVGLAVLLLVVSVVVGLAHRTGSGPGSGAGGGSTSASGSAPSRAAATSAPATSTAPASVRLRLATVSAPTWVSVHNAAGQQLFVGLLEVGRPMSFRASKSLAVRYGNTSTVDVTLGHKTIGHPHCAGHGVCTVTYPVSGSPTSKTG